MTVRGVVREWSDDEGWGVIDSDATPGGCWAHFSVLRVSGFRSVSAGDEVEFTYFVGDQDEFGFRAEEVWPAGALPVRDAVEIEGASAAYQSTLTIRFDHD